MSVIVVIYVIKDDKKHFSKHLFNKNLLVCVIYKEFCEKVTSCVMKWEHPAHKHFLEDL